jgi:hypothetical protein
VNLSVVLVGTAMDNPSMPRVQDDLQLAGCRLRLVKQKGAHKVLQQRQSTGANLATCCYVLLRTSPMC